jgi:hypothetical protein
MKIENKKYKLLIFSMIVGWIITILNADNVNNWIVQKLYFGGHL